MEFTVQKVRKSESWQETHGPVASSILMTANKFLLQEMDDGVGCLEIQKVLTRKGHRQPNRGKGMLEVPWLAVNPENDSLLHG